MDNFNNDTKEYDDNNLGCLPYKDPINYIQTGQMDDEIAKLQSCSHYKTGFSNVDAFQPFYSGLYVIGAEPGVGKTTYCNQMAISIAMSGRPVIYVSLEQSALEMHAKGIARETYIHSLYDPSYHSFTASDIKSGKVSNSREYIEQKAEYIRKVGDRLKIVTGNFSVTVEDIIATVNEYYEIHKEYPVVIIDYLQIIAPSNTGNRTMDTRGSIDHIVHILKAFQSEHNLTIILISSVNRENYMKPLDFTSFKESGGIEFTADVIYGLNMSIVYSDDFINGKDVTGKYNLKGTNNAKDICKRLMLIDAKAECPRKITLSILKNRFGIATGTFDFLYDPAHDYFWPVPEATHDDNDSSNDSPYAGY